MVLALSELTGYLLDRRYVHPDAVLDGGLGMVDMSSRHTNVTVSADPGVGLFIKQGRSEPVLPTAGRTGPGTTEHEAVVYSLLSSLPQRRRSGRTPLVVPRYVGFDSDHDLLVLELFPDATSLDAYHARTRRFPGILGTRLGIALADLHAHATGPAQERPPDSSGYLPS